MEITPSKKASEITYAIRNIIAEAKKLENQGKKILYCNIGDPCKYDFKTPEHIIEAAISALRTKENGYAPSYGCQEAREAISAFLNKKNGLKTVPDDIFVTTGASEGIELALAALLNPGENALIPVPGYPLYQAALTKLGAQAKTYGFDSSWFPSLNSIGNAIDEKTRAIILINPNNPTGAVYDKQILEDILALAKRRNLVVFSDEIYDKLIFRKKHYSTASLSGEVPVITLNGMSKAYLVPGWRIGWLALSNFESPKYASALKKLFDARLCSPSPFQYAISAALNGPQDHIQETNAKLEKRRDLVYDKLINTGLISCVKPEAAFYMTPKLINSKFKNDEEFILTLLKETGVLFVHGSGFMTDPTDLFFRIVYLPPENILEEAMDKFTAFIKKYAL